MADSCEKRYYNRKNLRAEFHDYSGGDYFVTICTREKDCFFGRIQDGEMCFSELGRVAHGYLDTLGTHYRYAEVTLFVVMPNHIHAIISIYDDKDSLWSIPTVRTALGVIIGGFKQAVTCYARRNGFEFGWQPRFHDHIIRGPHDGNRIAEYIINNPLRWSDDCFNPSKQSQDNI